MGGGGHTEHWYTEESLISRRFTKMWEAFKDVMQEQCGSPGPGEEVEGW